MSKITKTSEAPVDRKVDQQASGRGDEREVREESEERADRGSGEREITQNRELSEEVRLEMLRGGGQAILPDLPAREGYHRVWLSTTNSSDPIHRRMQLGYTPVRAADVPQFQHSAMKSGEFQGCVAVNEMIAFEIPSDTFNEYMKELHYRAPAREEEAVNSLYTDAMAQAAQINDRAQTLLTEEGRVRRNLNVPEPDFL